MATRQFDQPSTGATSGGDGSDPFCLDQDPDEGSARGDGYAGVYPTQAITHGDGPCIGVKIQFGSDKICCEGDLVRELIFLSVLECDFQVTTKS